MLGLLACLVAATPLAAQQVYLTDFETGAGPEWSPPVTSVTPVGTRQFLGEFGNDLVTLSLTGLPAHTNVQVSFDLFILRSWDGADAPDIWGLKVAGASEVIRTTFGSWPGSWQSHPHSHPDGRFSRGTGASETNTLGFTYEGQPMDFVYHLTATFPHSDATLALECFGQYLEWLGNESWGLDNVQVSVNAAPTNTYPLPYTFTVFAGAGGGRGRTDGQGLGARFGEPRGLVTDGLGNVFVSDAWNASIRQLATNGAVTSLAGYWGGWNDGLGAGANLAGPCQITRDADGFLYFVDADSGTLRKLAPDGRVTTLAGVPWNQGTQDGPAATATFRWPMGLARDTAGNSYIADTGNHTIRKLDTNGIVSTLAGSPGNSGSVDGTGSSARFWEPNAVAVDAQGNVFVSDRVNHAIRKVTPGGVVTTYAGALGVDGRRDGYRIEARFGMVEGLAIDRFGALYFVDRWARAIHKISPDGIVSTLAGGGDLLGSADGWGSGALFSEAWNVAVDDAGNVYVADTYNRTIRRIEPSGLVTTLAGKASAWGHENGTGTNARLYSPGAVAFDAAGNLYVADAWNQIVRKITPAGVVSTLAGTPNLADHRDGVGSEALFREPWGVAVDGSGNVLVGDRHNHIIRKIASDGTVSTLAGAPGQAGSADGMGGDARFAEPMGVAVDTDGNVYVADHNNHAIRKVTPGGEVTTLAGALGVSGNAEGVGAAARFNAPEGLAVDAAGNVYVADTWNAAIRKVTPAGMASTLVSNTAPDVDVDGPVSQVRLGFLPTGVAVDATGNVFIVGEGRVVRRLSPDGMLTFVAGQPGWDMVQEGTAQNARFQWPHGIAVSPQGKLAVADTDGNCVWLGTPTSCLDRPALDSTSGPVGDTRRLFTAQQTGSAWQWSFARRPAASRAELIGANTATPTFTPDVPDLYVFKLAATNGVGDLSLRTLEFNAYSWGEFHFAAARTNVAESLGTVNVRVDRTGDTNSEVSVDYYTINGTARGGDDFAYTTGTITFTGGQLSAWLAVPIVDDPAVEGLETFEVGLSNAPVGWSTQYPRTVTVGLLDNEALRPVIAELSPSQWVQAGEYVELTVRANGTGPLTYQWLLNGVAVAGATNATLRLHALTPAISGGYSVVVSNPYGSRTSSVLALNVNLQSSEYTWTIHGGTTGGMGFVDGQGAAARFGSPWAVATDAAGNTYAGDVGLLRKITPAGAVGTLAGRVERGWVEGLGGNAQFNWIAGLTVDEEGFIYAAETDNHIIRRVAPDGRTSTFAGHPGWGGSDDGTGDNARFLWPFGLTRDTNGNFFVADTGNHTIRKVTAAGVVTTLAGAPGQAGASDGTGSSARFRNPRGVAVDIAGDVYVADSDNACIRKVTPAGVVTTYAGALEQGGGLDGPLAIARFNQPTGLARDASGNLYVGDRWNHSLRKIGTNGLVSTLAGTLGQAAFADGTGADARFWEPAGVSVDATGNVLVADTLNRAIRKVTPAGVVTTLAGAPAISGTNDGVAASARFNNPRGIAADVWGNVYVGDTWNQTLRRISPEGLVSIVAGHPGWGGGDDGQGGDARFSELWGLTCDWDGNVFAADRWNHTIRKITPDGWVTTLAGEPGQSGAADGVGREARFNEPFGVAVDSAGNVFVADHSNHAIRRISPDGTVTTLAGQLGVWGARDGSGTNALFRYPEGLAVDAAGNVFVADRENHAIRKITPAGMVTTVVGHLGWAGWQLGRAENSRIDNPTSVAFDAADNLYISSENMRAVLKLDPAGGLTLVGGTIGWSYAMEGTGRESMFGAPWGVASDPSGVLYVSDAEHRIWRGEKATCPDWITLDKTFALVGEQRQFGMTPHTATSWAWTVIRRPANSTAQLVGAATRTPTFTPDVPDRYLFRLAATNDWGLVSFRTIELLATNTGGLHWEVAGVTVPEDAGTLALRIVRGGDLSTAASVAFATADGTARAGTNYVASSNVVAFASGQGTNSVSLTILNATAAHSPLTFSVRLLNPGVGWSIQYPSVATVTVTDASNAPPTMPRLLSSTASYSPVTGFKVASTALPNRAYRLWGSTNLTHWVPIQTLTNASAPELLFSDPITSWPARFYRVELLP
jgi:sugar lactone lactonase YvrE